MNRTSSDIPFLRRLRENRADLQYEKDIECVWPAVNNVIAKPLAEDDSLDLMFNNTDDETGKSSTGEHSEPDVDVSSRWQ